MCLRRGFGQCLGARVIALLVVAEDLAAELLRGLLDEIRRAALGAGLVDRAIPQHEIAVGIIRAAEERLPALRFPLDDLAGLVSVLRTPDASRLVLDVFALGIPRARDELAEAALLDDEIGLTPRALLLENLIRLGRAQPALLGGDQLARRLAVAGPRAGEELAEAAPLHRHRLAAGLGPRGLLLARPRFRRARVAAGARRVLGVA